MYTLVNSKTYEGYNKDFILNLIILLVSIAIVIICLKCLSVKSK